MALFKCKMCGGDLEITAGVTVAECEYCGAQQTIPKLDDDRRANLYDRANHFRRNNEFDKAMGIYEQILNEDNTDAEAYWSLVLCRYGIEYVEDPSTRKRVPTVNRAQFTSIFDDDNYKSALQNADSYQRAIYEAEAKTINEIQKGILAISQREEPFDVFICYKASDNAGRRTPDSVLANDLYHQLVQEGFKVFFARITLEDKLGSAYEPYIFAALNSAKVMVVLGTRPEYFNAVWVKNEWSRYLSLIKNGAKKMLIPAYKDMDPYDLPEEFSHLQAQDMSKLGFMQDLIRGIKKILDADASRATVVKETIVAGNVNTAPLLKRAFMFLEDGDWAAADEYCEKVLDLDPECAEAYLGKLMAEMQVKKRGDLNNCKNPFDRHNHYQKAMRFAGDALKKELQGYIDSIVERNLSRAYNDATFSMKAAKSEADFKNAAAKFSELKGYKDSKELAKKCIEEAECARLSALYNSAASAMASAKTEKQFKDAATSFSCIKGFKDAEKLAADCLAKAEEARLTTLYDAAFATMTAAQTEQQYKNAAEQFGAIKTFRDADSLLAECHVKAEESRLTALYDAALAAMNSAKTEQQYKAAAEQFDAIKTFCDAQEQYYACLENAEASRKDAIYSAGIVYMSNRVKRVEDLQAAIEEFQKIYGWKDTDDKIIECQDLITKINAEEFEREQQRERDRLARIAAEKKRKRLAIVAAAIVCACMIFAVVLYTVIIPNSKYNDAIALMESGKYSDAISAFEALDGYKDSGNKIQECNTAITDIKYSDAIALMDAGKYDEAISALEALDGYKDSVNKIIECQYLLAQFYVANSNYTAAHQCLQKISSVDEFTDRVKQLYDRIIDGCRKAESYDLAISIYKNANGFSIESEEYKNLVYEAGIAALKREEYLDAAVLFGGISGYLDADAQYLESQYQRGLFLMDSGSYEYAIKAFEQAKGYKDADTQIKEAKYQYVKANESRTDTTTHAYLKELKAAKYKDSADMYNERYKWTVKIFANNDANKATSKKELPAWDSVYIHIELSGGEPGAETKLTYKYYLPGGYSGENSFDQAWSAGESGYFGWKNGPYEKNRYKTGTMKVEIYDGNGNKIGEHSIELTY